MNVSVSFMLYSFLGNSVLYSYRARKNRIGMRVIGTVPSGILGQLALSNKLTVCNTIAGPILSSLQNIIGQYFARRIPFRPVSDWRYIVVSSCNAGRLACTVTRNVVNMH